MGMEGWIFILVIALVIDFLVANQFYQVAKEKGHNEIKYLWLSFFLGIIGYLLVIALPDRGMQYFQGNGSGQGMARQQTQNPSNAGSAYNDLPEL